MKKKSLKEVYAPELKEEAQDTDLNKKRESEDMQFVTEATDDAPREPWAKYGKKVDDFINDMVEKCDDLFTEGEDLLHDKDDDGDDSDKDDKFKFVSARMAFLKNARSKLAQRYEGLRRED